MSPSSRTGRGATTNPPNRVEAVWREVDHRQLAADDELLAAKRKVPTTFSPDKSESLIRENTSPDVPFRFSINAYRGCEHGWVYCRFPLGKCRPQTRLRKYP